VNTVTGTPMPAMLCHMKTINKKRGDIAAARFIDAMPCVIKSRVQQAVASAVKYLAATRQTNPSTDGHSLSRYGSSRFVFMLWKVDGKVYCGGQL
jgi:hypothetical protein